MRVYLHGAWSPENELASALASPHWPRRRRFAWAGVDLAALVDGFPPRMR